VDAGHGRAPPLSEEEIAKLDPAREPRVEKVPYSELFRPRWLRRTVFTAAPWFLMDIATYGVGMFTPTILSAIIVTGANTNFIADDIASTEGTALVDLFLVLGFALAILLIEKVGRVKLQSVGFAGMAIGMAVLGWANILPGGGDDHLWMVFLGFFVFNTLMNMGPNSTTFLLPAEVFPTRMRATGHGFAAGCGKVGASIGIVILPYVQDDLGVTGVAFLMSGVAALGLIITLIFQVETTGKSLEDLDLYEPDKPSELAPAIE
jgi:nitrate/nitrite transporter NarK